MQVKRRRHSPEQVIRKLREAERMLAEGRQVPEVAKALEVSEQTFHRWRVQYGAMTAEDVKRLKELERENVRLKRIVADKELEIDALREVGEGKLVSPPRRRQAVRMLQDRLGVSERRACQIAGQHRSTQRHQPRRTPDDGALRGRLREISRARPRWGYRRAHSLLREEGWCLNRKRTQRLWREEGLRVPQRRRKRQRLGESTVPASRLVAERPDQVWALDFQFDQTADGRILKLLHVVDEFTREALAIRCERRIDADATVRVLERLVADRGTTPEHIRCDNGPELTANALRDWCRFNHAGSAYIEPGSPWQNPYVESFGSRIRDELLGVELFQTLSEAKMLIEDWRHDYNTNRPHSALGMMAPARFAASWRRSGTTNNRLSSGVDR
ncbi:MAG: IS3 family transposase [Gaiellaceae bacterium]